MAIDHSQALTFSHEIEISEQGFIIRLHVKQPFDLIKEVNGWFKDYKHEYVTKSPSWEIVINAFSGRVTSNGLERGFVPYLGELETVNAHQWEGTAPFTLKTKKGQPMETERAKWAIACVEQSSLDRMSFAYTHANKDDVFKFQMRLGQVFGAIKQLLKPWEDVAREHFTNGYNNLDDVPNDHRQKSAEMLSDVVKTWRENTPIWAK